MRQLFHLHFHLLERSENRHAFGEYAASGERQTVLRQVAGADAARDAQPAVIERLHARQHFEQRGFAAAVRAHQTRTVLGRDHPVEIFKQQLGAEALAGAGKLNHLSLVSRFFADSDDIEGSIRELYNKRPRPRPLVEGYRLHMEDVIPLDY